MPVSNISKFEIAAFANWNNLRVPHEFEWEVSSNALPDKYNVNSVKNTSYNNAQGAKSQS